MENKELLIYTIYDHPLDFPDHFVLRRSFITRGKITVDDNFVYQSKDLDSCRNELIKRNLFCLGRDPQDPPHIVESWI